MVADKKLKLKQAFAKCDADGDVRVNLTLLSIFCVWSITDEICSAATESR